LIDLLNFDVLRM